jgi:hypothetical protein
MSDDKIDLLGVSASISGHSRPSVIGFIFYELLSENGYSDEEIEEAALAMVAIVAK